jgi:hypothetical protein
LSAAALFRERLSIAICTFNGELTSEYGTRGPWVLTPIRARTQTVVARAVARLRAIPAPAALRRGHLRLTAALSALLTLGLRADAAPNGVRGREYLARMPIYQNLFFEQARLLRVDECAPIVPRRAVPRPVGHAPPALS